MQITQKSVTELFGIPGAEQAMLPVGDGSNPHTPKKITNYVFRKDIVRDIRAFIHDDNEFGMAFIGHAGCGKTTSVQQFYAACGLPLYQTTATGSATVDDLLGGLHATENGSFKYVKRSLLLAMEQGVPILIDEYNNFSAETALGLNTILEGNIVTVEATGETITPAAGFKVYIALNDDTGLGIYNGRKKQDISNNGRFQWQKVTYPTEEEETRILEPILSASVTDQTTRAAIIKGMVTVARKIRAQFIGDEQAGGDSLEVVLTTRDLCRWARLACTFAGATSPVAYGFARAFGNSPMPSTNREAIYQICEAELGEFFKADAV
jgi:cobaltochelatase CobS